MIVRKKLGRSLTHMPKTGFFKFPNNLITNSIMTKIIFIRFLKLHNRFTTWLKILQMWIIVTHRQTSHEYFFWNPLFDTWSCLFWSYKSLIISLLQLLQTYRCRILKRFVLLLLQNPSSFWLICFRLLFLTKKYLMFETRAMLIKGADMGRRPTEVPK